MAPIWPAGILLASLLLPVEGSAQYGVPSGAGGIRKPSGTSCRTVHTYLEERPDSSCEKSGQRIVEVKELECSHFKDGHLDAVYPKLEEHDQDCVPETPGR